MASTNRGSPNALTLFEGIQIYLYTLKIYPLATSISHMACKIGYVGPTCLVTAGEPDDVVMDGGHLGGSVHVFIAGMLTAVLDVLRDGAGKQHTLLAHHRDLEKKYTH